MRRTLSYAVATLLAGWAAAACDSEAQRREAEHRAVKSEVVHEVERICALPEPRRSEELQKLNTETHYALVCAQ